MGEATSLLALVVEALGKDREHRPLRAGRRLKHTRKDVRWSCGARKWMS